MKKGVKNLAIAAAVGVAATGLLVGCKTEDPKPYIQVSGLDTGYLVGQDINLEGAKILYYSDKNDKTADEITLQESMIANFSTEQAGEKVMKVLWNGFELEIDYSVVTNTDFINAYNTAYENFMNATDIHADMRAISNDGVQCGGAEISNNKYYDYAGIEGEEISLEHWIQKEGDIWYVYEKEEDGYFKEICSMIVNDNVNEYVYESLVMMENQEIDEVIFNQFEDIEYNINGTKTILSFKINGGEGLQKIKLTIEDGKFVEVENYFFEDGSSEEIDFSLYTSISYNAEDVNMVDLPTNVDWQ